MAEDVKGEKVASVHLAFEKLLSNLEYGSKITRDRVADVLGRLLTAAPYLHPSQTEVASGHSQGRPFIPVPYQVAADAVSRVITALRGEGRLPNNLPSPRFITVHDALADRPGRPYRPLSLGSPEWAMVGVKVGHRAGHVCELFVLVTGLDGTPIEIPGFQGADQPHHRGGLEKKEPDEVADEIASAVREICHTPEVADRRILGVGVEVAGHVFEGEVIDSSLTRMFGVDLGQQISRRLDTDLARRLDPVLGGHYPLPVVVDNDLNVLAVLETYKPRSPERNVGMVAVFDDGVGSAIISDGRVYRGGGGMAGEIGHLAVQVESASGKLQAPEQLMMDKGVDPREEGKLLGFDDSCYCGAPVRHLDCYAPTERLRGELRISSEEEFEKVAMQPARHAGESTEHARAFQVAGTALGTSLASFVNLLNPSRLLLFLPPVLANAEKGSAAGEYLKYAITVLRTQIFSNAKDQTVLKVYELTPERRRFLGAQAAAVRVMDSLLQHSKHRCRCYTERVKAEDWMAARDSRVAEEEDTDERPLTIESYVTDKGWLDEG